MIWLHVEKTGGSFASSAEQLGYAWVAHAPAPLNGSHCKGGHGPTSKDSCRFISLFRHPFQRETSWFYFYKAAGSCIEDAKHNDKQLSACFKKHVHTNYYGAKTERTAVGCQCKHVLGYACQTPISKLPNNLRNHTRLAEAAIQRTREVVLGFDEVIRRGMASLNV